MVPTENDFREDALGHGVASSFIWHLPSLIQTGDPRPFILLCRVSTQEQMERGNLQNQLTECFHHLDAPGLGERATHIVKGVESSHLGIPENDRPLLCK